MSYVGQPPSDMSLLYAALMGPLSVALIWVMWVVGASGIPTFDPHFTFGYYFVVALQMGLSLLWFILVAGIISLLGLALFGIPFARWLGVHILAWPGVVFALVSGAIAGGILSSVLLAILGFDSGTFILGAPFGASTGFWFWFFHRRVLLARAALEAQP